MIWGNSVKTDQSGGAVIEDGTFGLSSLPVILKNLKLYKQKRTSNMLQNAV